MNIAQESLRSEAVATDHAEAIAEDIRSARRQLGLTRIQLASRVGCSISMLSYLEAGARPKKSQVLARTLVVLVEEAESRTENSNQSDGQTEV